MDDIPELLDVLDALQSKAAKWLMIGLQLHLSADELDIIKADCDCVQECLTRVVRRWQSKTEPRPTWRAIIDALKAPTVAEAVLAKQLEEKFAPAQISEGKSYFTVFIRRRKNFSGGGGGGQVKSMSV